MNSLTIFWLAILSLAATMTCLFMDYDTEAIPLAVITVVVMCAYMRVRTGEMGETQKPNFPQRTSLLPGSALAGDDYLTFEGHRIRVVYSMLVYNPFFLDDTLHMPNTPGARRVVEMLKKCRDL